MYLNLTLKDIDETPPSFKIISESACGEDLTSVNCNTERWSFEALVNDNGTGKYVFIRYKWLILMIFLKF